MTRGDVEEGSQEGGQRRGPNVYQDVPLVRCK